MNALVRWWVRRSLRSKNAQVYNRGRERLRRYIQKIVKELLHHGRVEDRPAWLPTLRVFEHHAVELVAETFSTAPHINWTRQDVWRDRNRKIFDLICRLPSQIAAIPILREKLASLPYPAPEDGSHLGQGDEFVRYLDKLDKNWRVLAPTGAIEVFVWIQVEHASTVSPNAFAELLETHGATLSLRLLRELEKLPDRTLSRVVGRTQSHLALDDEDVSDNTEDEPVSFEKVRRLAKEEIERRGA